MMKRKLAMFLAVLCLTVLTAGCGTSSEGESSFGGKTDEMATLAGGPPAAPGAVMDMNGFGAYEESGTVGSQLRAEKDAGDGSKLIYTADLNLETTTFDETVKNLSTLEEELGGWTQSSSVSYGGSGYRYGSYSVRVPKEKFSTFLTQAGELAHVTYTSSQGGWRRKRRSLRGCRTFLLRPKAWRTSSPLRAPSPTRKARLNLWRGR